METGIYVVEVVGFDAGLEEVELGVEPPLRFLDVARFDARGRFGEWRFMAPQDTDYEPYHVVRVLSGPYWVTERGIELVSVSEGGPRVGLKRMTGGGSD